MSYSYEFKPQALSDLQKLPKNVQKRIIEKLDYFISTENPLLFADHLINLEIGSFRFRVGDYRVIFDLEDKVIIILTLGHRKEIYTLLTVSRFNRDQSRRVYTVGILM